MKEVKMAEEYIRDKIRAIKKSKTKEEIDLILNEIYEEGFDDGFKEGQKKNKN